MSNDAQKRNWPDRSVLSAQHVCRHCVRFQNANTNTRVSRDRLLPIFSAIPVLGPGKSGWRFVVKKDERWDFLAVTKSVSSAAIYLLLRPKSD